MRIIKLTVEVNTNTIDRAVDSLGAGGYAGAQEWQDQCHYTLTVPDMYAECLALSSVIRDLLMQTIPFQIEYLEV